MLVVATLGVALQAWGSEPEVEPVIRFGDPADAIRVTLARAHLARVTGTRVNAGGIAAQVDFEAGDWPELVIRATAGSADWMGVQALTIPFDNPTAERIELLVRVDDDPRADGENHSLSGRARLRPNEAGLLVLPLPTNDALPMGMVAGPPREAPRLGGLVRMIAGSAGRGRPASRDSDPLNPDEALIRTHFDFWRSRHHPRKRSRPRGLQSDRRWLWPIHSHCLGWKNRFRRRASTRTLAGGTAAAGAAAAPLGAGSLWGVIERSQF